MLSPSEERHHLAPQVSARYEKQTLSPCLGEGLCLPSQIIAGRKALLQPHLAVLTTPMMVPER